MDKDLEVVPADRQITADIHLMLGWHRRPGQAIPAHLDGSAGANRPRTVNGDVAPCPNIESSNDAGAIACWLTVQDKKKTRDVYRKEAVRLMAWAIMVRHKALSDLVLRDMVAYRKFLEDIPASWQGKTVRFQNADGTLNPKWAPFAGQLSVTSRLHAMTVVSALFDWLKNAGYLSSNPVALIRNRKPQADVGDAEERDRLTSFPTRYVSPQQKEYLWEVACEKRPLVRWLIALLRYTGMRIEEVSKHHMSDFIETDGLWFIKLLGKGNKPRDVSIMRPLVKELMLYRTSQGWTSLPLPGDETEKERPLVEGRGGKGMSARNLMWVFKGVVREAGERLSAIDKAEGEKLKKASPHWLRHSYITDLLESGADQSDVQDSVGHSRDDTTKRYLHKKPENVHRRLSEFEDVL